MRTKKTDNSNLGSKLALREYFLNKYDKHELRVIDCCSGNGILWNNLKNKFTLKIYVPVDMKRISGQLQVDSVRLLSLKPLNYNVVDIDTYGSPWKHWLALLPNIILPTTVFLTIGSTSTGPGSTLSKIERMTLKLNFTRLKIPASFMIKLFRKIAVDFMLALARKHCTIIEAIESESGSNARYIGVRLEPLQENERPQGSTLAAALGTLT